LYAKGARQFIKTGDMVTLDGTNGTVELAQEQVFFAKR
jgi:phosphohistidine swiveling domain-containing protein